MSSSGGNEDSSPWNEKTAAAFESKAYSKYLDPCQEAASRSLRCLQRNAGDKEMCQDFFQAYRECKKNWMEERKKTKSKWSLF